MQNAQCLFFARMVYTTRGHVVAEADTIWKYSLGVGATFWRVSGVATSGGHEHGEVEVGYPSDTT